MSPTKKAALRRQAPPAPVAPPLDPERRGRLVKAFLAWYGHAARDLPWRRTRDPYAIWLSEVMLQQTRVDTVIPYWHRFLNDFPTVHALAAAPIDDVLLRWSGLGYYRRARQLHLAANEVVARYGGVFPRTAAELRGLSGIGDYTAGAVASIAFDEPEALVDGNVIRVLARIEGLDDDMRNAKGRERVWALARQLVPAQRAGDFNQSLMELGSQVCTPRAPRCETCPVRGLCASYASGAPEARPVLAAKKAPRAESLVSAVLRDGDSVLLGRRRDDGLYGGMWEPPTANDAALATAALERSGLRLLEPLESCGAVRHVLSHKRLAVDVLTASLSRGAKRKALAVEGEFAATYARLELRRPDEVALSTLARKVLKAAGVTLLAWASFFDCTSARAEDRGASETALPAAPAGDAADGDAPLSPAELERFREWSQPPGPYARFFTTLSGGRGVRMNNPFRLRTQLGARAESLSLTAPYLDVGLGLGFGDPFGLQHGPNVHASFATSGVPQGALSASYMLLYRGSSPFMTYGRAGAVLLTAPDVNVGGEVAAGVAAFVTGAFGVTAELVGDLFYGAGTYEKQYTVVPVVSLQLGVIVDVEVLP